MGTSGNSDGYPDGGAPDGLPDLPPDWGPIVIPDDPAELATEAALIRRELRQRARHDGWRRRLGLAPDGHRPTPLRLVLLILSITVVAALISLVTAIWPGQPRQSPPRSAPTSTPGRLLPALDMVDERGETVPLRGLLPAIIIFVDECDCADKVDAAARTAPPEVTVIALTSNRAEPIPIPRQPAIAAATVRSLADPAAELRNFLRLLPRPGVASAILVRRSGQIIRTLPTMVTPMDYHADLARLTVD